MQCKGKLTLILLHTFALYYERIWAAVLRTKKKYVIQTSVSVLQTQLSVIQTILSVIQTIFSVIQTDGCMYYGCSNSSVLQRRILCKEIRVCPVLE